MRLDPKAYRRTPWKNGGGVTIDIADAYAPGAAPGSWSGMLWRLGRTQIVDAGAVLRPRRAIDRILTVIGGRGLVLEIEGGAALDVREPFRPVRFRGEDRIVSRLEAGPVAVLNLLADRTTYAIDVAILTRRRGAAARCRDQYRLRARGQRGRGRWRELCARRRRGAADRRGGAHACGAAAAASRWRQSVRVARRDVARDLGAFFQVAADREIGRGRAGAIGLLEAAVAAVEARDQALAAARRSAPRRRPAPASRCARSGPRARRRCRAGNAARRGFRRAAAGRSHRARVRPASPARGAAMAARTSRRTAKTRRHGAGYARPMRRGQGARRARVVYAAASIRRTPPPRSPARPAVVFSSGKPGRAQPAQFGQFLEQRHAFAGNPAAGKAQDDEMARHAAGLVARDELAMARERDRLDRDAGFLRHLAHDRLVQRLAGLDHAARQREHAGARALGAPRDQHVAVADDRRETARNGRSG